MKLTTNTILLVAAASLTSAVQHQHGHRRFHDRERRGSPEVVTVKGPTVIAYEFDGNTIPESEVCKGIKNGTLAWAVDTPDLPDCDKVDVSAPSPAAPVVASSSAAAQAPEDHGNAFLQKPHSPPSDSISVPTSSIEAKPSVSVSVPDDHSSSASGSGSGSLSGTVSNAVSGSAKYDAVIASNVNTGVEFPDGEIDCNEFPQKYGAIPIDWLGLGGWAGVQHTSIVNDIVGNIETATSSQGCSNNGGSAYCSYACPPGYQKSQWPEQDSGTSVGGLLCGSDNKLHLTNPSLSKQLCIKGTGLVSVVNKLGKNAAICRTEYPGTESEVVPLNTQPGQTYPLTCPDSRTYFKHLDSATTAQYYVNPSGLSVDKACSWGQDDTASGLAYGNWAPVNMGVGTDDSGATWISLLSTEQNFPDKVVALDYSINLKGDFGGASCSYTVKNGVGQFCSDSDCQQQGQYVACKKQNPPCNKPVPGCTVQLFSGTATYELSS